MTDYRACGESNIRLKSSGKAIWKTTVTSNIEHTKLVLMNVHVFFVSLSSHTFMITRGLRVSKYGVTSPCQSHALNNTATNATL